MPQPPTVLLFSGFGTAGAGLVGQLQTLYRQPGHRALLEIAADAVDRATARFGPGAAQRLVPGGLPLRGWLRGQVPLSPGSARLSVVEGLLTHLMHLCLIQPGAGAPWRSGAPVVGLGHSLGLISAVLAGLRTDPRQFLADANESVAIAALTLLRCQQAAGDQRADPALARRYAEAGGKDRPAPMAAVSGADAGAVRELLAGQPASPLPVEIGLLNGPKDVVLTGDTTALLRLWSDRRTELARLGASWTFLRNTVPFHHTGLAPALAELPADRAWAGAAIGSDRLDAPVYATDAPRNLQGEPDLYADCLAQIVCRPLDWVATVGELMAEHGPSRALDFGPGVAVRLFTRNCLEAQGRRLEYVTVRPGGPVNTPTSTPTKELR